MYNWFWVDLTIVFLYGLQHSLLTTRIAISVFNQIFPEYLWNLMYSIISILILWVCFLFWEPSGITIFYLTPGSIGYHVSLVILALSLFFFFYLFKYTTSLWQWLGVQQVLVKLSGKKDLEYYRVRKDGIKKYIRFPHHTCLMVFFWAHPVMTLDTLLLAISATIYLYLGTYHQDARGRRLIGKEWEAYSTHTNLLLPGIRNIKRMASDLGFFK